MRAFLDLPAGGGTQVERRTSHAARPLQIDPRVRELVQEIVDDGEYYGMKTFEQDNNATGNQRVWINSFMVFQLVKSRQLVATHSASRLLEQQSLCVTAATVRY